MPSAEAIHATNQLWSLINGLADGPVATDYYGDDGLPTFSFSFARVELSAMVLEGLNDRPYCTIDKTIVFDVEMSPVLGRWFMHQRIPFVRCGIMSLDDGSHHLFAAHDLLMGNLQPSEIRGVLEEFLAQARYLKHTVGALFEGFSAPDL